MTRHGFLIGFLVGGWIATLLVLLLPHGLDRLGLDRLDGVSVPGAMREAQAQEDRPTTPRQPLGPNGPTLPGPTVNPLGGGPSPRGFANPGGGTSDSNNRAIALAASIGSGESAVYYFDTEARRLCVYQYKGAGSSGGLRLLAARYIDYDLKLETYRDLSEKSPREMRRLWEASRGADAAEEGGRSDLPTRRVDLPGGIR